MLKTSYVIPILYYRGRQMIDTNDFKVDIVRIYFLRLIGQRNAMSHFSNAQINKIIIC